MALFFGGRVFAWYLHVEHHRAGSVVMHSCSLQSAPLLACTYSFLSVSANKECIYKLFLMATVQHLHMLAYCVIFIILKYLGSFTLHTWPIKTYLPRSPHYCDSLAWTFLLRTRRREHRWRIWTWRANLTKTPRTPCRPQTVLLKATSCLTLILPPLTVSSRNPLETEMWQPAILDTTDQETNVVYKAMEATNQHNTFREYVSYKYIFI